MTEGSYDFDPTDLDAAALLVQGIAKQPEVSLAYTEHAKRRIAERGIIIGDVLFALRNGDVKQPLRPSTRPIFFKIAMETRTPNSDGRFVRVVAIPDVNQRMIKVITVMWVDDPMPE